MTKRMLTAAGIAKLRPGPKRREVPDAGAPGLRLVVQPSGTKTWAMRFRRPDGTPAKLTLGPVDLTGTGETEAEPEIGAPLTLAAARRLAVLVHHWRAQGRDVVEDARAEARRREQERGSTFAAAATRYVEEYARQNHARWRDTARCLGVSADPPGLSPGGLAERWRDRPVTEIGPDEIYGLVDECRQRGIPGVQVRRPGPRDSRGLSMHRALSAFFGWCVEHRLAPRNPCVGVWKPRQGAPRDRVLSADEIRWFWTATGEMGPPFGPLFRLLLLTGQRESEVARMTRAELSADGTTWHLPAERTKNRLPHDVPLSGPAREVLASVPRIDGPAGYVFSTTGRSPVSGFSKAKARLDAAMAVQSGSLGTATPWRLHDLRRTAVTGMVEIGVDPHVVEAVVNHVSGTRGGVAGVYNRARLSEPKREALERWADYVAGLVGGNVVAFPGTERAEA